MSFIAGAIIGSAVIGGVGSAIAGRGAAKAQQRATDANIAASKEANELNYKMFQESRGSGGNAVLPLYFGGFESQLSGDVIDTYKDSEGVWSPQFGSKMMTDMGGSLEAGNQYIDDVYSDRILGEKKALMGDVSKARREAVNTGLSETLGRLKALRSRSGLGGGSSFQNNLMLGATTQAREASGVAEALEAAQLYDQNNAEKAALLREPFSRIEYGTNLDRLMLGQQYAPQDALMQRLAMFNLGQGQAPQHQPYFQDPIPNSQMIAGSAISQAGNALGSYFSNRAMTNQLAGEGGYPVGAGTQTWSAGGSAPIAQYTPGMNFSRVQF